MPNAFSVQLRRIDSIRPYEANPRINDQAVDAVAAGLSSFGDAKTVDLFRYAAWLTLELFKPRGEPQTYEERKRRQPERHAAAARAAQDIGEIPGVVDPGRKAKAEKSFRFFCNTYFPDVFYLQYMCGVFSNKNLTTAETWCIMRQKYHYLAVRQCELQGGPDGRYHHLCSAALPQANGDRGGVAEAYPQRSSAAGRALADVDGS